MVDKTPQIRGIAESVLYSEDLARSLHFFRDVLGLAVMVENERMLAFDAGTAQVLLVFLRGATDEDTETPTGIIPAHRGDGPAHLAFHVSFADYDGWKALFGERGVPVTSEVTFPMGGRSLYFNDPDGNVLELATPGHWRNF